MIMMPRLEAKAHLGTIEAIGLAMGSADDDARRDRLEKLRSQMLGDLPADQVKRRQPDAEQLAGMGVAMTIVGPGGKPIEDGDHG